MSVALSWHELTFPGEVTPEALASWLRALHGIATPTGTLSVLQLVATPGKIVHYLAVPEPRSAAVRAQSNRLIGLVLTPSELPAPFAAQASRRLWLSSGRRPLNDDPGATALAILASLSQLRAGEQVTLQWLLGPVLRPVVVPSQHAGQLPESWPRALAVAPLLAPKTPDSEARRLQRRKQAEPGWRAVGRIAVQAASRERGHALLGGLLGAIRTAEGPGARLGVHRTSLRAIQQARRPLHWPLALTVPELSGLIAWPVGDARDIGDLPVARRSAQLLTVPRGVMSRGRVLAVEPTTGRPIAISTLSSTQHVWTTGPTGSGKSTLLLNLITQDMAAGRAVVVLEPKGDLIRDVLARVPESRRADVVLLDPSDPSPAGLNPLADSSAPDLVADQLLTIFHRLNPDSWGPRLAETLHTALLTLARTPGMTLAALPPLLTNEGFRRRLVAKLDDPLGVSPIWAAFERQSDEAKSVAVASVLNKTRALTSRPALRAVIGQAKPRFQLGTVFHGNARPILLANFAKGAIGPDSARLLGTLLLNQLWNTALARGTVAPERRHVVAIFVDELQDYVGLPADLGEMLAQARGLGLAFHLANQFASQLPPALLAGAMANARTRAVFQADSADALLFARGHHELTPEDFTELPAREVYLRLSLGDSVTRYLSGRTLPPAEAVVNPDAVAAISRKRYGVERAVTDRALTEVIAGGTQARRPIGRTRGTS